MKSRTLALLVAGLYGFEVASAGHCRARTTTLSSEPSLVTSIEAETETTIPSSIPSVDLPTVSDIPSISESETAAPTSSFAEEEETASSIPDDTETPSPSLTDLPTDIPTDTVTVATETETETATETDTESATESEAETATETAIESATETVTESVTESETESATESDTETPSPSLTDVPTDIPTDPVTLATETETATETAESSGPPSAAPTVPASFKLVSTSGPTAGKSLQGRNANGFYLAFNTSYLPDASLSFEAETGYLRPGSAVYACATYLVGHTFALLATCTPGTANWRTVTCEPPSGETLQCSAPACDFEGHTVWGEAGTDMEGMSWTEYTLVCDPDAEPWTHFYSATYELPEYQVWNLGLGPENATGDDSLVPIDLTVQAVNSS